MQIVTMETLEGRKGKRKAKEGGKPKKEDDGPKTARIKGSL